MSELLTMTPDGLYCAEGDFHIDPWRPVARAVTTHLHSDHARRGCGRYLLTGESLPLARLRLGGEAVIDTVEYGEQLSLGGVNISLHPAGHMLGAAQVRVERGGEVWVITGDYKRQSDATCADFELIGCHTLVTESTFGLPVYRWPDPADELARINAWWRENQSRGKASILYAYAVGKAQRLLAGVDPSIGPIHLHGAIAAGVAAYREAGVALPATSPVSTVPRDFDWSRALVVAVPSAHGSPWMRRFGDCSTAMASGWMRIRGARRRRSVDRGFVISDHVDWPALMATIDETGAERIWVTHGYSAVVARYLQGRGRDARALDTRFRGDDAEEGDLVEEAAT